MVHVEADVVFGTGGGRELRLDIYRPGALGAPSSTDTIDDGATAVMLWHGGGWSRGERTRVAPQATALAEQGFVVLSCEYRLNGEALWPAQIHDTKAAIRWTRANASRLGIDPNKIAGLGHSAGAHLTLMAAGTPTVEAFEGDGGNPTVSSALQAAVAVYPPTLLFAGDDRPSGGSPANALAPDAATPELAREASPIEYVTAEYPPTFLMHGTADRTVPVSATFRMTDALRGLRTSVETHIFHDQPHGFASFPSLIPLMAAETASFLRRTLSDPAVTAREFEAWQASNAARTAAAASVGGD